MTAAAKLPPPHTARVFCFAFGAAVYLISFFLPAVSSGDSPPIPGIWCAFLALNPLLLNKPRGILAIAAGLLNPTVLCYAAAWLVRASGRARLWLALGAVLAVASAAAYLHFAQLTRFYGFYAWAFAALLITVGDLLPASRPKTGQASVNLR